MEGHTSFCNNVQEGQHCGTEVKGEKYFMTVRAVHTPAHGENLLGSPGCSLPRAGDLHVSERVSVELPAGQ